MIDPFQSRYETIDVLDPSFTDITTVSMHWDRARGGAFAPPWSAIDLSELPPHLVPRVCVVDVVPDPLDFVYRFWGTAITNMHKLDATKESVRTVPPADYGALLFDQYRSAYEAREPVTFACEFENDNGLIVRYVVRRHPLSNDGDRVTGVLSIEEHGKDRKDLTELFGAVAPPRSGG